LVQSAFLVVHFLKAELAARNVEHISTMALHNAHLAGLAFDGMSRKQKLSLWLTSSAEKLSHQNLP
jgi:hypothetical protein